MNWTRLVPFAPFVVLGAWWAFLLVRAARR